MKLFITDYDGTLFVNEKELKKNITMLKKLHNANFRIMISTGRSYPSIKNQVDTYHIPYDYLSCADGSIIYNKTGQILKMFLLNKKVVLPIQKFYQNLQYEEIQFSYPSGYSNILKDDYLLGINICISNTNCTNKIVNSFLDLHKKMPDSDFLNYPQSTITYLCIKPHKVSKAITISYLMDRLNISKQEIYVIGDSPNDYEMIKNFNGVCMESSHQEILKLEKKKYKSVSDYIKEILKEN